jgi:hypothetical protein
MNDKTAAEKLQGYWILEIGELAGMKKADIDKVKAFISRQDDKYRASFGRGLLRIRGNVYSSAPPTPKTAICVTLQVTVDFGR